MTTPTIHLSTPPISYATKRPNRLARRALPLGLPIAMGAFATLAAVGSAQASVVSNATIPELSPATAYSPDDDEFLVVWQSDEAFGGSNIYGRRYDGAGAPLGSAFTIAGDLTDHERDPAVAYNPVTKGFVVAYVREDGSDSDIEVAEITRSGTIVLTPFRTTIASDGRRETDPSISYSASAGAFIVTYALEYAATDHDLFAIRVSPTSGAKIGSRLSVSETTFDSTEARLSCATEASTCMVAYRENYSSPLNGTTNILTQGFDVSTWSTAPTGFLITMGTTTDHRSPAIAADADGAYLLVWEHEYSATDTDVLAQKLDSNGEPVGQRVALAAESHREARPDVSFIDTFDEFYVAWQDQGPGATSSTPFGIRARGVPSATPHSPTTVRQIAVANGKDNLSPAVALSGDYPDVGMVVWEHVYSPAALFAPADTDIHFELIPQSAAP